MRRAREVGRTPGGIRRGGSNSGLGDGFFDEHHGDVADDRIDPTAADAPQAFFDDGLFAAELVAVAIAQLGAAGLVERDDFDLVFTERAGENLEKLRIDRHGEA